MNSKLLATLGLAILLSLTACKKKEGDAAEQVVAEESTPETTPEQQAEIDAIDQPNPERIISDEEVAANEAATDAAAQ